jgi:chitodextrinase
MSPQQVNPLYYQTYLDYLATGKVERPGPTVPTNLASVARNSQTIRLTWDASTDNVGVVGYLIFRDEHYAGSQRNGTTTFLDEQLEPGTTYTYQVRAFDAAGNQSKPSNVTTVTTPEPRLYPTNIALHKLYTATMPADPSYPIPGGLS